MKKQYVIILLLFILLAPSVCAQGVGINTTGAAPDASAILDVSATTRGALFPRMTTAQRNAIPNPATGLLIYNLDIGCYQYFDGNNWFDMCGEQKEKPLMLPWNLGVGSWTPVKNMFQNEQIMIIQNTGSKIFRVSLTDKNLQERNFSFDWIDGDNVASSVAIDSTLYLFIADVNPPQSYRVYKYNLYNIGLGGTQVSFTGLNLSYLNNFQVMSSDGTSIYFNYNNGSSPNDYMIARYSITSPTVFTYQNSIICGSTPGSFQRLIVDSNGNLYGGGAGTSSIFMKYNSSGTYIYQTVSHDLINISEVLNWGDTYYMQGSNSPGFLTKICLK